MMIHCRIYITPHHENGAEGFFDADAVIAAYQHAPNRVELWLEGIRGSILIDGTIESILDVMALK